MPITGCRRHHTQAILPARLQQIQPAGKHTMRVRLEEGAYNRVTYIDGLQQTNVDGTMTANVINVGGSTPQIGICIDSASCTPTIPATNTAAFNISIPYEFPSKPLLGLHFFQSMEQSTSTTAADFAQESLRLKTEY